MLFSRSRVAVFLLFIFVFMASIFIYTDELIEDQIDRLGEDLLSLQASMVAWVTGEFQKSSSAVNAEAQIAQDRFTEQQFQILMSMISNAPTNAGTDEKLILEFSGGAFGLIREDGSLNYNSAIPEAVILRAYDQHPVNWALKKIERVEISDPDPAVESAAPYVLYFARSEKNGGVIFTGGPSRAEAQRANIGLDAYLKDLYETRGYESYILNNEGKIINAHDPSRIGTQLSWTDSRSGISLFQKMLDQPDQKFELFLDQHYEAYALPLEDGHMLLMKPTTPGDGASRFSRILGYGLILFNLAIVTIVLMFLRKNHAFVVEKISLTEMQVKRRREAAGFIVVVIVIGFTLMILLINGLLSIQMTQLDFDKELQRFSDAMAGQYSEAYASLEAQNAIHRQDIRTRKAEQMKTLYGMLRSVSSDTVRKYPSTASSSDYVVNWMRVSQTTREWIAGQYNVDLGQVEDYMTLSAGSGMTLIGYDAGKLNLWVIQSTDHEAASEAFLPGVPLAASEAHMEGFFAHYALNGLERIPVLEAVLPDSESVRARAEEIGMALYHDSLKETIGIRKLNSQSWIVYVPTSDPLSGDLRQAAYDFTRAMSLATLALLVVVVVGWRHYGGKEPVS